MITCTIDGKRLEAEEGTTLLELARANGVDIPTLCYLEGVNEIGACRLCLVEAEGYKRLLPACRTRVRDGMVVRTTSERLEIYRREMLRFLLSNHRADCMSCAENGSCALQRLCNRYGVSESGYEGSRIRIEEKLPLLKGNPYIQYDPGKCIHCQRCIGACCALACNGALKSGRSGVFHTLDAPFGEDWRQSRCESCGNCAAVCPTGALTMKRQSAYRAWETQRVRTTCPHCGTGCQLDLIVRDGRVVDAKAADGPANHGLLCVKGKSASFDFICSPDRLKTPLIRNRETGVFEPASWEEAISFTARRFLEIRERYGPDTLAGFACSRSTNEDVYMLQKLVRVCFGTNNTDNCARVCHSATVAGLARTLGSGAMTNTIRDITQEADCIFLIGSNPEEAHPVIGMQIRQAVRRGTRLIIADPRGIGLAHSADLHLKLRPGTNVALINGMVHVIVKEKLYDENYVREHTEGFEQLCRLAENYPPEKAAEICRIDPAMLCEAARMYARAERAPIIYCLGVTEHSTGTEGVMCLSNLALLTGKLGRPGCGINPLRGQNNVQGACDMGALSTDFPGYQKVNDPAAVRKFEEAWFTSLNPKPGIRATDVFPAAIRGEIRGLYICGENPMVSDPDTAHIEKALQSLDFLVVQDLFMTETASYADVILPAASFAEKEGTFTNTERRVQRVRKAVEPIGESRPDTDIFIDLMNAMGYPQKHMDAEEIMDEIAALTPSYAGISHARLDAGESLQWPCPDREHPGTPILHAKGPARGKGLLYPADFRPAAELPDEDYPFLLTTGRILCQYNAASISSRTPGLMEITGEGFLELHFRDAERLGISDGETVRITSRRGSITAKARVGGKVSEGEIWMPFHFPDAPVNRLTNAALDELARIPEYKVCAVRVEKLPPETDP